MKRKINNLALMFTTLLALLPIGVKAAGNSSISMSANRSQLVVGNTVTYTVTISASSRFSTWAYAMNCSSNLSWNSGNKVLENAGTSDSPITSKTLSFTYKAVGSGNATCTFNINSLLDYNEEVEMGGTRSASKGVSIITQAQLEASYSKNNYLSSLSIEGYQLTPAFNKNTLEYDVELPYNATSINISASKEDSTASINGTGKRSLAQGMNKLNIVVTAQNGSTRTYVINANVKDLDPIIVTINGKEMNVVRKKELVTSPNSSYEDKTITIDEKEVPAFYNPKTRVTLVSLKDSEGNIKLYIYNSEKASYTLYNEYKFNAIILNTINDSSHIPEGYERTTILINDIETVVYKLNKTSKFALFYAVNVETGISNIYMYNENEKTVQIYNDEMIELLEIDKQNYMYIIFGLTGLLIITYFCILIALIKNRKKVTKKRKIVIADNGTDDPIKIASYTETIETDHTDEDKDVIEEKTIDISNKKRK